MSKLGKKIAFSIITGGLFIIVSFSALEYQRLDFSMYNIIGFLIAFIFLFGVAMGQNFAAPVNEILQNADNVSKGNLKKINLKSKTKDEIEDLALVFDKITEDFQNTKSEVETLKKSAEIKFKTKTLLSEQVIVALEEKIKNRTADLEKAISELEVLKQQIKIKDDQIAGLNNQVNKKKTRTVKT